MERAGQFVERLEIILLADDEFEIAFLVRHESIGEFDVAGGEIEFQFVAEAARNRAFDAETSAPQFVREAKPRIAETARRADRCEIIHQSAARLE